MFLLSGLTLLITFGSQAVHPHRVFMGFQAIFVIVLPIIELWFENETNLLIEPSFGIVSKNQSGLDLSVGTYLVYNSVQIYAHLCQSEIYIYTPIWVSCLQCAQLVVQRLPRSNFGVSFYIWNPKKISCHSA